MSKERKRYTKEEKLAIVSLSQEKGANIQELAERFKVTASTIYNWRSTFIKNKDASFPGHGNKMMSDSEREISKLKRALKEVELERDILKKAVGIFSRDDKKYSNL